MFLHLSVSHSVQGGMHGRGSVHSRGHVWQGCTWGGACVAGETATEAGGTHPTGMHSCLTSERWNTVGINYFIERFALIINIQIFTKLCKNHNV